MEYLKRNYVLAKIYGVFLYYISKHKKTESYIKITHYTKNKKLMKDAYYSVIRYNILPVEYFLYDFYKLNDKGRKEFIGNKDRKVLLDGTGSLEIKKMLTDKYLLYKRFTKYYKREIILVNKNEYVEFEKFCKKLGKIIIKPYDAMQGSGIRIIDSKMDLKKEWEEMFKDEQKSYVLEELIVQSEEFAKFHPLSINTVRFATYYNNKNDKVYNAFAFVRLGVGDMKVDNLAAGGISAIIDTKTGIIITPAQNMEKKSFLCHPDTNVQIIGFKVPKWDELKKMASELARDVKDYNYISWDFALTDKGWVIVEANARGGLYTVQMHGKGIRKRIMKIINGEEV